MNIIVFLLFFIALSNAKNIGNEKSVEFLDFDHEEIPDFNFDDDFDEDQQINETERNEKDEDANIEILPKPKQFAMPWLFFLPEPPKEKTILGM